MRDDQGRGGVHGPLERAGVLRRETARVEAWNRDEGAYQHQHRTQPLSLAVGISDSPVGLLAWILEKYRAWSDRGPGDALPFTDDFLVTQASIYWFTNTIGTSLRPYYEALPPHPFVTVPTALALFPADLQQPPRAWAERTPQRAAVHADAGRRTLRSGGTARPARG